MWSTKSSVQGLALGVGEVPPPHDGDALLLERRAHVAEEDVGLHPLQLAGDLADLLQHLARFEPGRGAHGDAGGDPALEPGHPDHEELVEVAAEDGEELGPLQQRDVVRPWPAGGPAR